MKNALIAAIVSAIVAAGAGSAATLSAVDQNQNTRIRSLNHQLKIERARLNCVINTAPTGLEFCLESVDAFYAMQETP